MKAQGAIPDVGRLAEPSSTASNDTEILRGRLGAASLTGARPMLERLDTSPDCTVAEPEYRRLLGYPQNHTPGERARELAAWARRWYAENGRPWVYLRETALEISPDASRLDGEELDSPRLRDHLSETGARRVILVAVSAGRACEEHARQLWEEGKPDEYFFLEILGSAVVEHLVAGVNARICELAEREGFVAVPHYSPGYTGWDIRDQHRLNALLRQKQTLPWPEEIEVLPSGMLRPKKTLLAVVGLRARLPDDAHSALQVPCTSCSYSPCNYRRAPYRHPLEAALDASPTTLRSVAGVPVPARRSGVPLELNARYSISPTALAKWSAERVTFSSQVDGTTHARFRFDGTTCSNLGQPLAFDYEIVLGAAEQGFPIQQADCRPAAGDTGHMQMCAYLQLGPALLETIAAEKPLLGRPLDDVLTWSRPLRPSGCYCDAESRTHKWGLALEAIHFALARQQRQVSSASSSAHAPTPDRAPAPVSP